MNISDMKERLKKLEEERFEIHSGGIEELAQMQRQLDARTQQINGQLAELTGKINMLKELIGEDDSWRQLT